jgi:capsular exopolysaccharide synthesis family protein
LLNKQPHLKDYLRIILARRWMLISASVIVVLGALVWVLVQTPIYRSTATLLIQPKKVNVTEFKEAYDPTMTQTGGHLARQEFYETQHKLIQSRAVLEQTFEKFNFGQKRPFKSMGNPIDAFRELFTVSPVRGSRLVNVSFQWKSPELAARVVDYHVKQYIQAYKRRALGVTTGGLQELKKKADELRPELEQRGDELQEFMVAHNMVSVDKTQNVLMSRLRDLNQMLGQTQRRKIEISSIVEDVRKALERKRSLENMPEVVDAQTVRDLKLEYVRTKQRLEALQGQFGRNHPEIVSTGAKLQTVGQRLRQEMHSILETKKAELQRLKAQEAELQSQINKQQQQVMKFNKWAVQYDFMQDSYDSLKNTYEAITKRIEEIEISLAAGSKGDNIFVISPPEVPPDPAKPRKKFILLLASLGGLTLGTGLCFFVDYLDTTVKGKEDAQQIVDAPVLGYVPAVCSGAADNGDDDPVELHALDDTRGPLAESFRSIRTALAFSDRDSDLQRTVVTSSLPREGKTLVSVNIALALAQADKRVLLVDADMRKPRIHKILDLPSEPGLSSILAGDPDVTLASACQNFGTEHSLSFLPCGPIPPNPSELLGADSIETLLEEAEKEFDAVVFDTPPVVNVTDAAALSQHTGGALLVMRTFSTQQDFAERAVEAFEKAGSEIRGVILNTVDVPRGGYYGYDPYYRYYHSSYYYYYGKDETGEKVRKRRKRRSSARA